MDDTQRGAPRGWKGRSEGPQAHNISPSPARRAQVEEKEERFLKAHRESRAPTRPPQAFSLTFPPILSRFDSGPAELYLFKDSIL